MTIHLAISFLSFFQVKLTHHNLQCAIYPAVYNDSLRSLLAVNLAPADPGHPQSSGQSAAVSELKAWSVLITNHWFKMNER